VCRFVNNKVRHNFCGGPFFLMKGLFMGLLDQQVETTDKPTIELTFYPKDAFGKIIGAPKTVSGDGFQVWRGWQNGNGPGAKISTKKPKPKGELPKGKEADKLAKEAASYAEQQQESR